ncbi:unnamed protein product [Vitrella brassicaformis CCMP3155]|uniref:Pyrroline-5-carboxylate reductase n=1 Tax=Vitrella brassicaformis (strain CCMP3155) TaxID=1169540 RepID=A0A0G4G234_VITBC|nr:unnamed protein product [Vitrella brassicaformis CCMP3155]|eukprot:CEM22116.1 unnamed protein product [Vitrella brassicaformis CCMP3155]
MNGPAKKIGFIGAGQMATALAKGFVAAGCCSVDQMLLSDAFATMRDKAKANGFSATASNTEVVNFADVVFVSVKPHIVQQILPDIKAHWTSDKILVSIAAGVKIDAYQKVLGADTKIIRVMPNTPCLIGKSAAGYALSTGVQEEDGQYVEKLLKSVGVAYPVPENLLDAVTGVSGSGPAFVYTFIEAMSDAGVKGGLPRAVASGLAAQTVLGAAAMVLETGTHPAVLREQVTSPGGTTIAGVAALEENGMRHAVISAIDAARLRATELSKQ